MGVGLEILSAIQAEKKERAARRKAGKSAKDVPSDPRYSADEMERLLSNTSVFESSEGEILLRPATCGPRKGRAPRLIIPATEAGIEALAEGLRLLIADEAAMKERLEETKRWRKDNA